MSEFLTLPWGLAWLALLGALVFGWFRMKAYFPTATSPSRTFSQGDFSTNSTCLRMIALILYASGSAMILFAFPLLITQIASEQSQTTGASILAIMGIADVIAGVALLRNARCRRDMADPVA